MIHTLKLLMIPAFMLISSVDAAINYSFELNTPTSNYSYSTGGITGGASASASAYITGTNSVFNASFSILGDETLTVEMHAPEGKEFYVNVPTGWNPSIYLGIYWGPGGVAMSPGVPENFEDLNPQITFEGFQGTPLTRRDQIIQLVTEFKAGRFGSNFAINPGDSFSFTSISMQTVVPASYNVDFTNNPSAIPLLGSSLGSSLELPDPGQWISLRDASPIPEPSIGLLSLLGGALLMRRRR